MNHHNEPWWVAIENILAGAIGFVILLIAFDLIGVNPIHHSGRMARLTLDTVYSWVQDYDD